VIVRRLTKDDWPDAEALYTELTKSGSVAGRDQFLAVLAHDGTEVFGYIKGDKVVSMVTLHVLPNMTYGGRPYALIENVVTAKAMQKRGYGRATIEAAVAWARQTGCYKLMLLAGRGRTAKGFYDAVGFSADDKWGMTIRL